VTDIAGKVVTDEYYLTFKYACWTDTLSINFANNLLDQIYSFGQPSTTLPSPVVTQSVPGCTMAFQVFGNFNQFGQQDAWADFDTCGCLGFIISTFNHSTGQLTIFNNDGTRSTAGDLKPQTTLELKIVATSTYSTQTTRVVEDSFNLKMY